MLWGTGQMPALNITVERDCRRKRILCGLTRGYIVLVGLWLLYCYAWLPLQIMDADMMSRINRGESFDDRAWLVKYAEIVFGDSPAWLHLVVVVVVPVCGYVLFRFLIAIIYWVRDGFR